MIINDVKEIADYYQDFIEIFLDLGDKVVKGSEKLVLPGSNKNFNFKEAFRNRFELFNYSYQLSEE